MELSLISVFAILIAVCVFVAIDQSHNKKSYILGEEWDFTRPTFNPKRLDRTK